jgi:PKD repeat protein
VNFTDTSTGGPTTWAWNFGDGGTSNLQNPSHTYSTPGTYTVSLTVTNSNGSDTETKTGYITAQTPVPPSANFTGTPTSGSAPLNVNFTDTSTGGPTTWAWNFGDGGTSNLQNPSHTYSTPGTYTVSLTVTNSNGSDTETKTSYITVSPIQLPTISVTTPNGGERWTIYRSQAIRWTYSGNPGSTVRIELYKSGVLNRVITPGTSTNAGVYYWFIPYTQAIGSDYRIKITSTSNPSYSDMSNANFSITWGY